MKAIVQHNYGPPDVLEFGDIVMPVPGDDDVLVKVRASSVNAYDWHLMRGTPYIARLIRRGFGFGLFKPITRIRGRDVAGMVEAVGRNVTQLQPGDEVYGQCESDGAYAEYVCTPESALALKPANLTLEEAAAVPLAANTALLGLRDHGQVQAGQRVLINGASGGVGTFAIQIAKSFGAEVTAVCSTGKMDVVQAVGADHVIDYTREDFTGGEQRYDVVFDGVANRSLSDCRRALTPEGTLVLSGGSGGRWLGPMFFEIGATVRDRFVRHRLLSNSGKHGTADLIFIKELIESGQLRPVIDKTYGSSEAAEAIRHMEERRTRGKVVIAV
ncbi:MAG: NAD(P)-dependent alcohol dehydrogenase [Dehalococcoidia bacterium]|nr:NAD(P)-dependent alcohol dehydrogenase [Dehalococcoidia bacterium]